MASTLQAETSGATHRSISDLGIQGGLNGDGAPPPADSTTRTGGGTGTLGKVCRYAVTMVESPERSW
jgi:hypothetical protein